VNALDLAAAAFLLAGTSLLVIAGIGLHRFDDVFARMHAATKTVTLGLSLVCLGAALQVDDPGDRVKLLLVASLQFLTAPIGSHMLGRAVYRSGTELAEGTTVDELAEGDDPHS